MTAFLHVAYPVRTKSASSDDASSAPPSGTKASAKPYAPSYVVSVVDFETGEASRIVIDNGMTPQKYIAHLYQQARKVTRSREKLVELARQAKAHADYVAETTSALGTIDEYRR